MGGYSLDDKRRPTFFYNFKGARIEESFEPIMGEVDSWFKRTITLTGAALDHLYFRAAQGDIKPKGDTFLINDKIVLKFPGSKPLLRANELLIPIQFSNDTARITEEIIW